MEDYRAEIRKGRPKKIKVDRNVNRQFTVAAENYYLVKEFDSD